MYKYTFFDDYSEGGHPSILKLLEETNLDQEIGYGKDSISEKAKGLVGEVIKNPDAEIHFVSGGTQANLIILASAMKSYESVISAGSGHINIHEAGAIETTGHKINVIFSSDGKITSLAIQQIVDSHTDEHMVKPKVVFISNTTEVGTVYKKKELEAIYETCKKNDLYLYLDGARLGSALTSSESDLLLPDLCRLVDIFYIGGTKNGALFGEAIVINNKELQQNFRYHLKQRGALLAKGRVLGIQFLGLFTDNLYFELAKHANEMANKLAKALLDKGYKFLTPPVSNQIFPILPNTLIDKLQKQYGFYVWSKIDKDNSTIRLVTSWATKEEMVEEFIRDVKSY